MAYMDRLLQALPKKALFKQELGAHPRGGHEDPGRSGCAWQDKAAGRGFATRQTALHCGQLCNLLRPLIKIIFLLVPCGYILIKIKKNS